MTFEMHEGKKCPFYRYAINIFDLQAGEIIITIDKETGHLVHATFPIIDTLMIEGKGRPKEIPVGNRGFAPEAVKALLALANKASPIIKDSSGWDFKTATRAGKKNAAIGKISWKLFAAWRYSWWKNEGLTTEQRHADMVRHGYPDTAGALRTMMSRMGLSHKDEIKELDPWKNRGDTPAS
tara:strand:+ start:1649 stop:2191 length:543 start_codon:yes stop_codon:yes gene_type:complete